MENNPKCGTNCLKLRGGIPFKLSAFQTPPAVELLSPLVAVKTHGTKADVAPS